MTIADQIAARGNEPVVWATIEGIPDTFDGLGAADPVLARFTSNRAVSWPSAWINCLAAIPTGMDESVDLVTGKSRMGSLTLEVQERTHTIRSGTSVSLFAFLFSHTGGSTQPATVLASDQSATGTQIDVAAAAVPAQYKVLWVGREAQIVGTQVGGGTWNVTRGALGTLAKPHLCSTPYATPAASHDSGVYSHPNHWTGRRVTVYLGDITLDPTNAANSTVVWTGVIDSIGYDAKRLTWRISCRSDLAALDGDLGRGAFRGVVSGPTEVSFEPGATWRDTMRNIGDALAAEPGIVRVIGQDSPLFIDCPPGTDAFAFGTAFDHGHIRIGDEVLEVHVNAIETGPTLEGKRYHFIVDQRQAFGSPLTEIALGSPAWEVVPSEHEPALYRDSSTFEGRVGYWTGGAFEATSHPAYVVLNVLLSTGTSDGLTDGGVNYSGAENYDTLPAPFGCGIPIARVDVASILALKERRPANVAMPGFLFNADAKPWNAKEWLEEHVLGPLGAFLYVADGQIACELDEDAYYYDSRADLGTGDVIADTFPEYDPRFGSQLGRIEFKCRYRSGAEQLLPVNSVVSRERRLVSDDAVDFEGDGIYADDGESLSVYGARGIFLVQKHDQPRPRVKLPLAWHRATLTVGSRVTVANTAVPNALVGDVGVDSTDCGWMIVGRRLELSKARTIVECEMQSEKRLHFGPSATITAETVGPPYRLTVNVNDFTPATGDGLPVPDRDSDVFAVGDYVKIVTSRGVAKSDIAITVAEITTGASDTIRLSIRPTLLGVNYAPAAGDRLVLATYGASTTAHEKTYAHLADESTATIGATTDPPVKYGG